MARYTFVKNNKQQKHTLLSKRRLNRLLGEFKYGENAEK